jgi:hypothetical protein
MEEKKEEIEDRLIEPIVKTLNTLWSIASILMWVFIYAFIILGSTASILLLIKLYPNVALSLFTNPYLTLWFKIMFVLFRLSFGAIIVLAVILLLLKGFIPFIKKQKERNEIRKEQFRKELIEQIIKGVKNARRKS